MKKILVISHYFSLGDPSLTDPKITYIISNNFLILGIFGRHLPQ